MDRYRPTRAEIDLDAIRHNVVAMSSFLGPDVRRLAVVKANAYGHGDVQVARACLDAGATHLGVALVEEGIRLRQAGIDAPIVIIVEAPPQAAKAVVDHQLTPSVFTTEGAEALREAASVAGVELGVHVCVDTGMHREGWPLDDGVRFVTEVARMQPLVVEGLWSHFAMGEQDKHPFTLTQIERFHELSADVEAAGVHVPIRHLTSSAGIALYPHAHFDMVRMGIMLYGLYPDDGLRAHLELRPAMRLVSAVSLVRQVPAGEGISYGLTWAPEAETTIANIPIGYGDGYPRLLTNQGHALIGGRRCRVAGRVTMDTTMVACDRDDVAVGDEAVLIGDQSGAAVTADEIADMTGTINYEVVCSVGPRVPRVYV